MAVPEHLRLAFATHNAHKVAEVWAILAPHVPGFTSEALVDAATLGAAAPVEDGVTFEANALIKARALCASTGLPAIADDSGIAVDVMGGAPGVFSARWAGANASDAANLRLDRKSTRLNSSHVRTSYAVFCLKKKNITEQ